jgi:hypothetical protein
MGIFAGAFQILSLIFLVLSYGVTIYIVILLVQFLKAGTDAFKVYVNKNRN